MPTEAELRLHRCCFTGHRPEKLNCPEEQVKALLDAAVDHIVELLAHREKVSRAYNAHHAADDGDYAEYRCGYLARVAALLDLGDLNVLFVHFPILLGCVCCVCVVVVVSSKMA